MQFEALKRDAQRGHPLAIITYEATKTLDMGVKCDGPWTNANHVKMSPDIVMAGFSFEWVPIVEDEKEQTHERVDQATA